MSGLSSSPWTLGVSPPFSLSKSSSSSSSYIENSKFSFCKSCHWRTSPSPSSNCGRIDCRFHLSAVNDLKFVLHDVLHSSDVNTTHAQVARERFCSQIEKLSEVERGTSISINREVDLGETALYIAAEDDSLISHSSVPLPVESFIERLDDLSMDYCSQYSSSFRSLPDNFLECLQTYLYVEKGFRRKISGGQLEQRALYLHSMLRDLKNAFWPFQGDRTRSLFLRAAEAANCYDRSNDVNESGFELASAKAARHRLERGVWTSVPFGDMRRALAACERLIIVGSDSEELRDYGALLYHCGFYEESLHYLTL